jgi:hypothetical protein
MNFLLFLAHQYNTCLYGTFLFNSEFERMDLKAYERYTSIWTDIFKNISYYLNLLYDPSFKEILIPNCSFYKLRFWEEYFLSKFTTLNTHESTNMLNEKLNDMSEVLNEIFQKTKDKDIFETFSNKAKNYLNIFQQK